MDLNSRNGLWLHTRPGRDIIYKHKVIKIEIMKADVIQEIWLTLKLLLMVDYAFVVRFHNFFWVNPRFFQ